MNQLERRAFLIDYLRRESGREEETAFPADDAEQKRLLRALLNLRPPMEADAEFLRVQDEYLSQTARERGIVQLSDLTPVRDGLYLWQGDITRLAADAIVNAANSAMTGCYVPNHACIDNCIHSFGGVQMRLACARIIEAQGHGEPTGQAKLTPGFNLPCRFVLHTVGPIIHGAVGRADEELLASCYRSCLELAEKNGLESVAFCCISTGVFHFPNRRAAEIAVRTVTDFLAAGNAKMRVIFNVYKDEDFEIYRELLG